MCANANCINLALNEPKWLKLVPAFRKRLSITKRVISGLDEENHKVLRALTKKFEIVEGIL